MPGDTPIEIVSDLAPGLFLGTVADSVNWRCTAICVLDQRPADLPTEAEWHPILVTTNDPPEVRGDLKQLDKAVVLVGEALDRGEKVLVCCGQGIERSPLAVVWYLYRRKDISIPEGYTLVRSKRPQLQERLEWLHGPGFPVWW